MTQLTFQPAFDPFHAVFRLLRLHPLIKEHGPLPRDHVRILDFCLLFPVRIRDFRLSPKHQKYKKLAEEYAHSSPYGEQPDAPLIFGRMEPMQIAALETLAFRSFIDLAALQMDQTKVTAQRIPEEIASRTAELNAEQTDLIEFLGVLASEYTLSGENGLKARTGLVEYRYDAI